MAFEANYSYTGGRLEEPNTTYNANLSYNPATGANFPFTNVAQRPFPTWGVVNFELLEGWSNYHGTDFTLTKRFSDRWQFSGNYTLSEVKNDEPSLPISGHTVVDFAVAPDLGGEYGPAVTDQRHRAVFNGIWEVGGGFQLSGLYFFGSGQRQEESCGGDRRDTQGPAPPARLCANGTIVPRNEFVQDPIHRMDVRLQQRIPLGRVSVDGILEIFNAFDRANYQSYVLDRSSPIAGTPVYSSNLSYAPRTMQLGFRVQF